MPQKQAKEAKKEAKRILVASSADSIILSNSDNQLFLRERDSKSSTPIPWTGTVKQFLYASDKRGLLEVVDQRGNKHPVWSSTKFPTLRPALLAGQSVMVLINT